MPTDTKLDPADLYLLGLEVHSAGKIREAFDAGLDPSDRIQGRSLADWVTHMYLRSPRFSECLRAVLSAGVAFDDPILLAVLLEDSATLRAKAARDPGLVSRKVDLDVTFTPLQGASLLHVAAEFGLVESARTLLELGADIEARATVDGFAFNGQTPVFHTVNQHDNHCRPVLELLLEKGAQTDVRLAGITWGRGFPWETTLLDVTLLSYTQVGLLPQFQRSAQDIYDNLRLICSASGQSLPDDLNVPNRYLETPES